MSKVLVVIPARYKSQRLPHKMVADLQGKALIVRTAERIMQCPYEVIVAYDDEAIGKVLDANNIPKILTSERPENGSERLAEVVTLMNLADDTIVVNVQGDEPFMPISCIDEVVEALQNNSEAALATLATPITGDDVNSPTMVKVVCNLAGEALYFSRSVIPFYREESERKNASYLRHLGIYAYRAGVLRQYPQWTVATLEQAEKLEQLRFLEQGKKIAVKVISEAPPAGIDTQEDLIRVREIFANGDF